MGRNDQVVLSDGVTVHGTLHLRKGDIEMLQERLAAQYQTALDEERPMLKGIGFVVVDAKNPRFEGEEFAEFEDAKAHANNVAYTSTGGMAIIYVPVLTMRPERPVAVSSPSKLLQQLGNIAGDGKALPGAPVVDVPADKPV